jgi:hypothetical protein
MLLRLSWWKWSSASEVNEVKHVFAALSSKDAIHSIQRSVQTTSASLLRGQLAGHFAAVGRPRSAVIHMQ